MGRKKMNVKDQRSTEILTEKAKETIREAHD